MTDEPETVERGNTWVIPECCREGWDDCPHIVNREPQRIKRNIGL